MTCFREHSNRERASYREGGSPEVGPGRPLRSLLPLGSLLNLLSRRFEVPGDKVGKLLP